MEQNEVIEKEEKVETTESTETLDSAQTPAKGRKPINKRLVISLVAVVVCAIACGIVVLVLHFTGAINPYEKDYVDITGRTAGDIAKEKNYKYEKFLKEYGLPADMPKSTSERAVFYNIPVKKFVEKTPGVESFEQMKADMGWDDTITEDTTMGDALDKTKLKYYVGEDQVERFKALYELDANVNGETLYVDVRNIVDTKNKEFYEAKKNSTPHPTMGIDTSAIE